MALKLLVEDDCKFLFFLSLPSQHQNCRCERLLLQDTFNLIEQNRVMTPSSFKEVWEVERLTLSYVSWEVGDFLAGEEERMN